MPPVDILRAVMWGKNRTPNSDSASDPRVVGGGQFEDENESSRLTLKLARSGAIFIPALTKTVNVSTCTYFIQYIVRYCITKYVYFISSARV